MRKSRVQLSIIMKNDIQLNLKKKEPHRDIYIHHYHDVGHV